MKHTLLICRSQTEAIGLRRLMMERGIAGELVRPPRRVSTESCSFAVRIRQDDASMARQHLRKLGIVPCRIVEGEA